MGRSCAGGYDSEFTVIIRTDRDAITQSVTFNTKTPTRMSRSFFVAILGGLCDRRSAFHGVVTAVASMVGMEVASLVGTQVGTSVGGTGVSVGVGR